jgi:hypothetical protein
MGVLGAGMVPDVCEGSAAADAPTLPALDDAAE